MPQASWQASSDNRYWIEVVLGNLLLRVMVDVGLVDPRNRVGFEVAPAVYQQIEQAGHFSLFRRRSRYDASGRVSWTDSGLTLAQVVDPVYRRPVGPVARVYVSRGLPGVPSRAGVVFFHLLSACKVIWDLDQRTWTIEYP